MSWYFTVNGIAACQAAETCDPRLDPPTVCAHATQASAEADARRVWALYPEAIVLVVEGHCPTGMQADDDFQDFLARTFM